ncbi:hypothetical protein GCM10010912_38790 [Paenibacillus albidus]|uniref:Uncharacterized protein n=1 Tax=Paenibacillus albidus TaxID=2041023 RepID=A0A917CJZ5_9BACL|nr:hypothetical protein [Paenibacillus albidus]GGF89870.1 hypothetical protein GCM10010912_38790 [Paenibacillus albidus]
MYPDPDSKNLETFKHFYEKVGYCYLVPAYIKDKNKPMDGSNIDFDEDYKLKFNNIDFRKVSDIDSNDIEDIILKKRFTMSPLTGNDN